MIHLIPAEYKYYFLSKINYLMSNFWTVLQNMNNGQNISNDQNYSLYPVDDNLLLSSVTAEQKNLDHVKSNSSLHYYF